VGDGVREPPLLLSTFFAAVTTGFTFAKACGRDVRVVLYDLKGRTLVEEQKD